MEDKQLKKVIFICTHNSCRSQMAEGLAKKILGEKFCFFSAGTKATQVDKLAIEVMAETGIDISQQYSKTLDDLSHIQFDYAITVCDNARQSCPIIPAKEKIIHVSFKDPPELAKNAKNKAETLEIYRMVRNEIKSFIENLESILN